MSTKEDDKIQRKKSAAVIKPSKPVEPAPQKRINRDLDESQYYEKPDKKVFSFGATLSVHNSVRHNNKSNSPKKAPSPVKRVASPKKMPQKHAGNGFRAKVLGVILGYNIRRIYNRNAKIIQYRQEFRDLIQFAF